MNMDDMFRHFFGFDDYSNSPRDPFYGARRGDIDEDEFENLDPREFGREESFHIFKSPLGIMKHLEEMFRNFGLAEFPPIGPHMPQIEPPAEREGSPREKMLRPDSDFTPKFHKPWYEGILERPSNNTLKEDSDLDQKVSESGLRAIVPQPRIEKSPHSYFSSVTIRQIRGADGKTEEHRTVRDSSGREETTIRRVIGNESHSVTIVNDADGLKEKKEDFFNLDEGGLKDFNKKWDTPAPGLQPQHHDDTYTNIFKKLFGLSPRRSEP